MAEDSSIEDTLWSGILNWVKDAALDTNKLLCHCEGSFLLVSSLETTILCLWIIQVFLIVFLLIPDFIWLSLGEDNGDILRVGIQVKFWLTFISYIHFSYWWSPPLVPLSKPNPLFRTWNTWRYCHVNLSYPSCGLSVHLKRHQDDRQLCPVQTLWKGSWCGSDSTCGCFPEWERCPAAKETLPQFLLASAATGHLSTLTILSYHAHPE